MKYIIKKIDRLTHPLLLLLIIMFASNSCIDLEEDTSSILLLEKMTSEGDIVSAITPVYRGLSEAFKDPHQRIVTFGGDDLTTWWGGNKSPLRVFDQFEYGSGENSDIRWLPDHAWDKYWRIIYRTNMLIDNLKTSTAPEAANAIGEGEARFARAMSYFYLVRMYGGMPLVLDGEIPTGDETRSTVLEAYKVIEEDLVKAANLLPHPGDVGVGRVSSAAANTLLARLYLTWGGWPVKDASKIALAATVAKKVIDLNYYTLLDINELWKFENQNSSESIFAVQYSEEEGLKNGMPVGFSFHASGGYSDAYPEIQFFKDFPEGPRKEATFVTDIPIYSYSNGVNTLVRTVPWPDSERLHPMYQKFTLQANFNFGKKATGFRAYDVFRYAEVLLLYAEAQTRVGQNAAAIEALNQVKRRAAGFDFLTPNPAVDVSSATANDIVDEAGWELAGEFKRWFDLVRTERVEEIAAKRDPLENVPLKGTPSKAHYIAPIPASAFLNGSKLTQNPEGFRIQ